MQLSWIEYFLTVARYESINMAAEEHQISQPAMSQVIKKLESELSVQLFERTGNRLFLNENGKAFREYAGKSMNFLRHGIEAISEDRTNPHGEVSVLLISNREMVTKKISEFIVRYPNVTFKVNQGMFGMNTFDSDICFATNPPSQKFNMRVALFEEDHVLAIPAEHPLKNRTDLSKDDLEKERFIVMPPPSFQNAATMEICESYMFTPYVAAVCDSPYAVCQLIDGGAGIAFIPSKTWSFVKDYRINLISVGNHTVHRTLYIWWNSEKYMSFTVRMFIESFDMVPPKLIESKKFIRR